MKSEASWLIRTLERAIEEDDAETGWYLQENISRVWNDTAPNSAEHLKLSALWKEMMSRWH